MLWNFLSPKKLTYFLKRQAVPQAVMKTTQVKKIIACTGGKVYLPWTTQNGQSIIFDYYTKICGLFAVFTGTIYILFKWCHPFDLKIYSVSAVIYMFHLKYLHVFYMKLQKHVKGENLVIYSLQSLSDDLHVEYMLFKKIRASTGFEPVTSAILVSRSLVEALIYSGFFLIA